MTPAQAHSRVGHAIRAGRLRRQPCEICEAGTGSPLSPYQREEAPLAHHDDYDQPLNVRWLCRQHHADLHRERGAYVNNGRRAS